MKPIHAISPIDGRYNAISATLSAYFSEFALIQYRVKVEIAYFIFLIENNIITKEKVSNDEINKIKNIADSFSETDAERIKEIEKKTNHDVKAVEYFIKDKIKENEINVNIEFVHFGLTSQDINNTAVPLTIKYAEQEVFLPKIKQIFIYLENKAETWKNIPMMARTHGQPASPTTLGKEIKVFAERLSKQINVLEHIPIQAKFGGASGNMNAHYIAFPQYDWHKLANQFLFEKLQLIRQQNTTQIEHYDALAARFQAWMRINTILLDFCKDIWQYISLEYFKQKINVHEIGSSAMPHKINPIDFENAEGNLGMANAMFQHISNKLPISRLQRDLTDSTVSRNIGMPYAYQLISFNAILKGLEKLELNEKKINEDLEQNWLIIAEAIQTVLRRENFPNPYESLKLLTRTNTKIGKKEIHNFIDNLPINEAIKSELKLITPQNYIGKNNF